MPWGGFEQNQCLQLSTQPPRSPSLSRRGASQTRFLCCPAWACGPSGPEGSMASGPGRLSREPGLREPRSANKVRARDTLPLLGLSTSVFYQTLESKALSRQKPQPAEQGGPGHTSLAGGRGSWLEGSGNPRRGQPRGGSWEGFPARRAEKLKGTADAFLGEATRQGRQRPQHGALGGPQGEENKLHL